MSHTLQLVVDDQLRNKLDETKHVDSLSEGSDDERVPSSVSLVHHWSSGVPKGRDRTYGSNRCIQLGEGWHRKKLVGMLVDRIPGFASHPRIALACLKV